jgi:trans-aconitate 2-methyltransferase
MDVTKDQVRDFYDDYSTYQVGQVNNERHFYVLDSLKKNGLQKTSRCIDLGCGIGAFSALLANFCEQGFVKAYDLSPKSIDIAKKNYAQQKNISFASADITNLSLISGDVIDFVLLVDVLEHIPAAEHERLFTNIAAVLNNQNKLIINIPYYAALQYEKNNNKEVLQIIDEPVELISLVLLCEKLNLEIKQLETFDMWQKEEYQFIVIEKKKEYVFTRILPRKISFRERLVNKIKSIF